MLKEEPEEFAKLFFLKHVIQLRKFLLEEEGKSADLTREKIAVDFSKNHPVSPVELMSALDGANVAQTGFTKVTNQFKKPMLKGM